MSIDPNIHDSVGPVHQTDTVIPAEEQKEGTLADIFNLDTLSPSERETLEKIYLSMSIPILPSPFLDFYGLDDYLKDIEDVVALGKSRIIDKMWESYSEYLEEQKERIAEYLASGQYMHFLEQQSPAWIAAVERDSPLETQNAIRSSPEFQEYLSNLPPGDRSDEIRADEGNRQHAGNLWNDFINGTAKLMNDRDEGAEAIPAITAAFVITSSFIGDYMNIVDVASTNMVLVNPIQDAAQITHSLFPPDMAEQATLAINLFVTNLIYFTAAEAMGRSMKTGGPVEDMEINDMKFAEAFAKNMIDKVNSGQVNYYLMALLVNTTEEGTPLTEDRMNQLFATSKAVMIAIALAVLYKVETGWIKGQEFTDMIEGKLEPRTKEESILIGMLQKIKNEMPESDWDNLVDALGRFFEGNPSVEDILNPIKAYNGILGNVTTAETRG